MTNNNSNRVNTRIDNDINRVVERARRAGVTPVAWQVVDTTTWSLVITDDTLPFERGNLNGRYLFTPVFDPTQADINGNPKI